MHSLSPEIVYHMTNNCPLITGLQEEMVLYAPYVVLKLYCTLRESRSAIEGHDSGSRRGRTGRMRFPNEES